MGRRLVLNPVPQTGLTYSWQVNGESVATPESWLDLVPKEPGELTIELVVREGEREAWRWSGVVRVTEEPPIPWRLAVGSVATLSKPPEFRAARWFLDGEEVASGPVYEHVFAAPGRHALSCLASDPEDRLAAQVLRRLTWAVEVTR